MVFGNMALNVKIFLNLRLEEFEDEEETNCIEEVSQWSLDLLRRKDPVESVIISVCTDIEGYFPQEEG